ncbi:MAG: ATP-dependent DNA helicase RecG [Bacteroidales bacterium]|nr:ATP-dependent DNA helicase RecG [Bacteroidales bacterium]
MTFLDTSIAYLKGVGPKKAEVLEKEADITTFGDMLHYFPMRYVDRSHVSVIATLNLDENYVVLKGYVRNVAVVATGRAARMSALFSDGTGEMDLVWFQGVKWIKDTLKEGVQYLVMGKPGWFNGRLQMTHPDMEPASQDEEHPNAPFVPVYPSTERLKAAFLGSKAVERLMVRLLTLGEGKVPENLPARVVEKYRLPGRAEALRMVHFPRNQHEIALSRQRFKFEELFFLQLAYQWAKQQRRLRSQGRVFNTVGERFNRFYGEKLPFELTGAQKRVVKEIRQDMRSGHQMNRLLQGDVGSGKTLVALLCMLIALDNGCQACLMAPTEILATQHYETLTRMLDGMDISVELLTGSLKPAAKKKLKERLKRGEVDILIGTHALTENNVQFKELGFVVIDEQHRFGVKQRSRLWTKSQVSPHVLVMTATPIPRTLAMTLYGDLDSSVIDELPPGRQPITTVHCTEGQRRRVFGFLKQQIAEGRQAYIVYPLIEESEKLDLQNLMKGYDAVRDFFPLPPYHIGILHGRLSAEDKELEMSRFKRGISHILVSTTVIEVGVDVPNATVMMIENAERFGLSQLHQLRGRVGRGGKRSYCILMSKTDLSKTAKERIDAMVRTTDGFQLAETDLKLRGPGDLQGLQQSGMLNLKVADIVEDEHIVRAARDTVAEILADDPFLEDYKNAVLRSSLKRKANEPHWEKIS